MRKRLLFIIIMIAATRTYGQVNIDSFYDDGAEWTDKYNFHHGLSIYDMYGFRYRLSGDTLINSINYKKLYYTNVGGYLVDMHPNGDTTLYYSAINYSKLGAVRTDSNRVYFILTDTTTDTAASLYLENQLTIRELNDRYPMGTEHLVYDFNATAGDSLSWKISNKTVIAIDTIILPNNLTAKKYVFADEYWIEGVGSSSGFLFGPGKQSSWVKWSFGICHRSPYLPDYHFSDYSLNNIEALCFGTLTETKNIPAKVKDLVIYPNPLQGEKILLKGDLQSIEHYEIYDVTGRLQGSGNLDSYAISVPAAPGSYILKLRCKDGSIISKIYSRL